MEKIYWKKLSGFKKFIFSLGWLGVINLLFWVAMLVYYFSAKEKKFWTPGSYRVVYVFGWVNLISIIVSIIVGVITAIVVRTLIVG